MTDRWTCESPLHVGMRWEVHPMDRYTRRQTFMRTDGRVRLHEESLDRICHECIDRERDNGQTKLI